MNMQKDLLTKAVEALATDLPKYEKECVDHKVSIRPV